MSETRYIVPKGMLEAADYQWRHGVQLEGLIEATLRWLAEHPMVPTDEQINEFYAGESEAGVSFDFLRRFAVWYQKRMFLEPAAVVPKEVEDLLWYGTTDVSRDHDAKVIEAYRRGQKSK
jgi:hypothetical protein